MATPDEVKAQVREQVETGEFLGSLADRIGARVQASAIFGQPVERGGVTVIPVAKATWGFGGGTSGEAGKEGSGGGGGGFVSPLGYIEVRESGAEFRHIRDPRLVATVAAAAIGIAALVARAVRRRWAESADGRSRPRASRRKLPFRRRSRAQRLCSA